MLIKYLSDEKITKEFASHIVAMSIAECGAMGHPGYVIFLTDENDLYEINYRYDDNIQKVFRTFDIFYECMNYLGNRVKLPSDWKHTYLGMGNHLFMVEWLDILFYDILAYEGIDRNGLGYIYKIWIERATGTLKNLLNKKNYSKQKNTVRTNFVINPYEAEQIGTGEDCVREFLRVNWDSGVNKTEKIVAIGINPSTATNGKSDMTVTKLCRFLDTYGFNNVKVINLYESVNSNQKGINVSTKTDFTQKEKLFEEADIILLVWGMGGHDKVKKDTQNNIEVISKQITDKQEEISIAIENGATPEEVKNLKDELHELEKRLLIEQENLKRAAKTFKDGEIPSSFLTGSPATQDRVATDNLTRQQIYEMYIPFLMQLLAAESQIC